MARAKTKRIVYTAWTVSRMTGWVPTLMRIYAKSSYQDAYNWIADIAERYGGRPLPGDGKRAVQTACPTTGQVWWIDAEEVH